MKKGQVSIFILVGVFFVAALVLFGWLNANNNLTVEPKDCVVAADCVPSECCDSDLCVPKSEAPDCSGVICQLGCENYKDNSTGCDDPFSGVGKGSCNCTAEGKCMPVLH